MTSPRWKQAVRIPMGLAAVLLGLATLLPLSRTDQWWIRVLDFPRMQLAVLILLVMASIACWMPRGSVATWVLLVLLGVSLVDQVRRIIPYTPLASKQLVDSLPDDREQSERRIRLMVCNLQYDLERVGTLHEVIREADPDIIIAPEYTTWWGSELERLASTYPYRVTYPREDGFGLLLLSRLELVEPEVRFLVERDVPSIRTRVRLGSGETIVLYAVHPKPPGLAEPDMDDRQDSGERDAELLVVAGEVADLEEPVIVAGDFNDVAWSHTSGLFQRMSGLLDPRIGRGVYTTYNAHLPFLRYPLDHVFVSDHFRLVSLDRLPGWGSDHFPILLDVVYAPAAASLQEAPAPDPDDREEAIETIDAETP